MPSIAITDLPAFLEDELDYPLSATAVRDRIGEVELEAPDADDSATIGELLGQIDDEGYESAEELHETILTSLPDEYVGRKDYSDRGAHIDTGDESPDEPDRSV